MAQHMIIADEGERFVIIPSTRKISVPQAYKIIGAVGDHNSEQLTFECPRYVDGHDVSECASHFIKWTNALGKPGTSAVDGIVVDGDNVLFTWTIPALATMAAGIINFTITFEDIDENGKLLYRWSSATCQECQIAASLIDTASADTPQPAPSDITTIIYALNTEV